MDEKLVISMINDMIKTSKLEGHISTKDISDVYHTFRQLYNHRTILFALVCNSYPEISWKSKKHFNEEIDPMFNGDFIAGINTPLGPATYHIKLKYWNLFKIPELERAYEYDGHNSDDDLKRLISLITINNNLENSKQKKLGE